jgi:hypothetical protein
MARTAKHHIIPETSRNVSMKMRHGVEKITLPYFVSKAG